MILLAIAFWQPMASMVTMAPCSSRSSKSSGMAVISFDFAAVATWPKLRCCSRCPGADQVQGAEFVGAGATQGLAVNGDMLDLECLGEGSDPMLEAAVKRLGIDAVEDAFEGVVRGNAVGKFEKAAQPIETLFAEGFDLLPILGAAQDGTQER